MKIIEMLTEMMEDEIHDIKKYAKMAATVKDEHPALSHVLYTISTQEDSHRAALHSEAEKIIDAYRKEHGAPPAAMMAVYEHLHKKSIERLEEAKRYQEIYKNM